LISLDYTQETTKTKKASTRQPHSGDRLLTYGVSHRRKNFQNRMLLLIQFILLIFIMLGYFKLADQYNIIDKPNLRSSHTSITIRGGGVLFGIAAILFFVFNQFQYPFFLAGLCIISIISFLDDVKPQRNSLRITVHLLAVALMLTQLQLFSLPWYYLVGIVILIIGTINAYNFMDGINGITSLYSLVLLAAFWFVNQKEQFVNEEFIFSIGMAVLVFSFFNVRKKAKCFAGDVGSVSMAFIILFLLIALIFKTEHFKYILFLAVYGVDTVLTIVQRLLLKENIFEAHRKHLYQYLANEKKWPHVSVSILYACIQAIICWVTIQFDIPFMPFVLILLSLGVVYIFIKWMILKSIKQ
jgi:UDP-N-acetylmuramyl pentapeptide phosphotransferase/UDP-N-acetylglucosamine-1-phosphate transferase